MGILVQYIIHPENEVLNLLKELLPQTGINERKLQTRIINGHPLFQEGNNNELLNSEFPAIGVEHTSVDREDSIGFNFRRFRNSDRIREFFQKEKEKPLNARVASDKILDELTDSPIINKFITAVKNEVIIAGYCSGIMGKNSNHILYHAVQGIMSPMSHIIQYRHSGVKVMILPNAQVNIEFPDSPHGKLWGFEITVNIFQTQITYMNELPEYTNLIGGNKFDVWIKDSKTQFGSDPDFFSFRV
ncbi:MAG TPA: hypothetical protein PKZ20_18700 [Rhodocyclaceae bacterium]|nr:hypothetical protein [Rhodocyclaceae bacterium]HNM04826.1 hypothetical protein [Leptospiraceae bacterium]HNO21939.1 hypothetical protein [Leptospiraceae bacterium]